MPTIQESTDIITEGLRSIFDRIEALEARGQRSTPTPSRLPDAAFIEIVERRSDPITGPGVIVPNEVRINGVPLLASGDHPVTVHEVSTQAGDAVLVTLTLFARRVVIGEEIV